MVIPIESYLSVPNMPRCLPPTCLPLLSNLSPANGSPTTKASVNDNLGKISSGLLHFPPNQFQENIIEVLTISPNLYWRLYLICPGAFHLRAFPFLAISHQPTALQPPRLVGSYSERQVIWFSIFAQYFNIKRRISTYSWFRPFLRAFPFLAISHQPTALQPPRLV
jgi:hypothetical protein